MKKILAICTSPDHGGLEIYFTSLAKYFNNKSNDVLIYPCFSKNSYIGTNLKDSVNHYLEIKNIRFFNILKYAFVISRYIQKHNINYIHISWGKDLLLGVLIKKLCKDNVKLIYYRQMKVTRNKHDIYHKFIYRNIDLVLVITEKLLNECQKFFPIQKKIIKLLRYGIKTPSQFSSIFLKSKEEFYKHYNLDKNIFTIGIFSRIEDQKGQHLVLEALSYIKSDRGLNLQLIIAGYVMDKNYHDKLKKYISDYKLESVVKFVSFLPHPDSIKTMSYLDLTILPTYEETFGLVIAESMLVGTPVIGSNAGGVPEIIKDGNNGLLFDPKNVKSLREKILNLYLNEDLRNKLSKNAHAFSLSQYNYDKHFISFSKHLSEIL